MTIESESPAKVLEWTPPSLPYSRCFQNYYNAHQYLRPRPIYVASIDTCVKHWQLRDLIQYDASNGQVYFAKEKGIGSYDMQNTSQTYCDLSYTPPCFSHANDGTVVAGGLLASSSAFNSRHLVSISDNATRTAKGLFSYKTRHMDSAETVRLGEMINNDVAVHQRGSGYDAYVCNNEGNLYGVDVGRGVTWSVTCEQNMCLNHVTRNPARPSLLAVTGDCGQIFLVQDSKVVSSIRTEQDFGFGTAFHPNGHLMSAVFQNGTCLLYDLRNIKPNDPLLTVRSSRPAHRPGAFRVCKFSPEGDLNDLLIVSEHVGRVHVIDLRTATPDTIDSHQVIVVPSALDQYGKYIEGTNKEKRTAKDGFHRPVDVYKDESFPASLVYDYSYLRHTNPNLFDEFAFVPPKSPSPPNYVPPITFNYPGGKPSQEEPQVLPSYTFGAPESKKALNGEMSLSGIEFCHIGGESRILVGCKNGGLLLWDVNGGRRRSFGVGEYI